MCMIVCIKNNIKLIQLPEITRVNKSWKTWLGTPVQFEALWKHQPIRVDANPFNRKVWIDLVTARRELWRGQGKVLVLSLSSMLRCCEIVKYDDDMHASCSRILRWVLPEQIRIILSIDRLIQFWLNGVLTSDCWFLLVCHKQMHTACMCIVFVCINFPCSWWSGHFNL